MTIPGITPAATHYHQNGIDFTQLKVSHISFQNSAELINWSTTLALLPLNSATHKTAVVDSKRGIYKVKETTNSLISNHLNRGMHGCKQIINQIDRQAQIKEYRPISHGKAIFFPLKSLATTDSTIWIACHHMEAPTQPNPKTSVFYFKDCDIKVILPVTWYFINSRINDCHNHYSNVEKAWQEVDNYIHNPISPDPHPCYIFKQIVQGLLTDYSQFITNQYDLEITNEELDRNINKFMREN
ncbi:competence protein ComK [Lentilactobacillus senioris]|uniref:competence protein ComK n=1 Tax=Lentilactobacillus senioris TaxID=931534 RepID=UPI00227F18C3|nr:competence protein ComK [Lentilactobacillus senioris]MCY9807343.1 competence protein ComK [Lentilactobacillus senioris]